MKKYIPRIITLAAITGWAVIAGNMAQAQTTDSLLADSVDQEEFPQVTAQPTDQVVLTGSNVVMSVQANNADGYQWLRNGVLVEGQTNSSLSIESVGTNDVGLYSCEVSKGVETVPTRAATLSVVTAATTGSESIRVFGTPYLCGGKSGTCPGTYIGYVSFVKTASQGWGWVPSTNTTVHTATDLNRTDTKIVYMGRYSDSGCDQTSVTVPNPAPSPKYRFTIYFSSDMPTNAYPITLEGFNP
jgi:hypothetical protein